MASPPPMVAEVEDEGEGVKWLKHYCSLHEILLVGEGDFSFSLSLANAFGSASNIVATSLDPHDAVVVKYAKAESNLESLKKMGAIVLHGIDATKVKLHSDLTARKFDRIVFNFPHAGFKGKEDSKRMIKRLVHGFFNSASHMLRADGEIHVSHKIGGPFCKWNLEKLARSTSLVLLECANFDIKDYPGYANKRGDGARCDQPFPLGNCCTFKFRICTAKIKQKKKPGRSGRSGSSLVNIVEIEDVRGNSSGNHHRQTIHHPQTLGFWMDARHQPNFLMGVEPVHLSQLNQPTERLIQNTCLSFYREHPVGVNNLLQGFDPNWRYAIQAYQRGVYVNEMDEEHRRSLHAYAYLRGGGHVSEAAEERHRNLHTYLRCDGHVNGADGRRRSLNAYLSGGDQVNVAAEQRRINLQAYLRGGGHANEAGEERCRILPAYLGGGSHVNEVDERRRSLHAYLRGVGNVSEADEEHRRSLHAYLTSVGHVSKADEERRRSLHAYLRCAGHVSVANEERHRNLRAYLGGVGHASEADEVRRRSLHAYLGGGVSHVSEAYEGQHGSLHAYLGGLGHVNGADGQHRSLHAYLGGVGHVTGADGGRHRSLHAFLGGVAHVSGADEGQHRSLHAFQGGVDHVGDTNEERCRISHAYLRSGGHVNETDEDRHRSLHAFMGHLR